MIRRFVVDGNPWHLVSTRVLAVALLPFFVLLSQGVPVVTRQPPETLVDELGSISTLSVEATGEAPLRYQWFRYVPPGPHDWRDEYIPLLGETNSTYIPATLLYWRQFAVGVYDQSGAVTSRVSTISVSERFAFQKLSAWPASTSDLVPEFRDFVQKDGTILAATRSNFVVIINVDNAAAPNLLGLFSNPGRAIAIERFGNIAAVASASAGVDLLDITNPRAPVRLATAPLDGNVRDLVMVQGRVYAIDNRSDTYIYPVDIANPAAPVAYPGFRLPSPLSGIRDVPRIPQAIVAAGTKIFCNSVDGRIRILDASDPQNIVQVGSYQNKGSGALPGVRGDFLFATGVGNFVLDISRPDAPAYITPVSYTLGGTLSGDFLISGLEQRIEIYDVSTPTQPAPVGSFDAHAPDGRSYPFISTTHAVLSGNNLFTIEAGMRLAIYSHLTNAPLIVTQPQDLKIFASEKSDSYPLIDTLEARGALPLTYQWYYGETGDTNRPVNYQTLRWLAVSALPEGGGAVQKFWVRVNNPVGFADSRTVTVTWIPQLRFLPTGQLRLIAAPSSSWTLQSSNDLRTWTDESNVTVAGGSAVGITDVSPPPALSTSGARFFRLQSPRVGP